MSYQLWHGDKVDDTGLWCPVCLDLSYENIESSRSQENRLDSKASPHFMSKGALAALELWWRARRDFKHRAEQYNCGFCAALLQIVDVFWKGPVDNNHLNRVAPIFSVSVRKDASVELRDMLPSSTFRPIKLLLYTPFGYAPVWGRLPPSPVISPSGNSKRAYSFLQDQLDICVREHKNCRRGSPLLPKRVLDLGNISSNMVQPIKIVEPHFGTPGKYIALSYCWGDGNRFRATKSNISELLQEVDEEELPATIRDAIEVARHLGVRYLWVDALCIIQDDTQDWIRESAHMAAIYGEAFLTIAASSVASSWMSFLHSSRDNGEYLFRLDNSRHHEGCNGSYEATAQSEVLGVRRTIRSGFHQDPNKAIVDPGMCRAWTLQEYLLSPRVVSFSADELQWMCRTIRACECGNPEELDTPRLETLQQEIKRVQGKEEQARLGGNDDDDDDIDWADLHLTLYCYRFWDDIVEAYCRRELSWARDKLPALSGVAHEYARTLDEGRCSVMAPTRPSRYLAGLWEDDIHRSLCWVNGNDSRDCAPAEYCAPSWSWASVKGNVYTSNKFLRDELIPQAEILEAACALANPDSPFGQVVREGTHLRVRGSVVETKMKLTRKSPRWGVEYQTPYGTVSIDCGVETVVLGDNTTSEQQDATAAATANMDNVEAPDLGPAKTVRRRRERSAASVDDDLERLSSSWESDSQSDAGLEKAERREKWKSIRQWEESNLGKEFTVWLLHLIDTRTGGDLKRQILALGRPAGDSRAMYERFGILRIYSRKNPDDAASDGQIQWPEHDKGLIRIITIVTGLRLKK